MARLFDNAQNEYLSHAAAVKTATPLALVCCFNSNDDTAIQSLVSISSSTENGNYFQIVVRGDQAGDYLHASLSDDGSGAAAITTSGFSANTWHHACGIFANSTDRRALLDGGSKGTDVANRTPTAGVLNTTSVGILNRPDDYGPMSGRIAEAAIYDLSAYPGATDSDKADYFEANVLPYLAAGERPSAYTTGLLAYWDLVSDDDDKICEYDLTPYNTPSWGQHPTVLCSRVEPASAVDSQNRAFIAVASITEAGDAIDSQSCSGIFNSAIIESATATAVASMVYVAEIVEAASATDAQDSYFFYTEIPSFMQKHLIDPYSGGAWLWLCEIAVPGYDTQQIARNTADVCHVGKDFTKANIQIGKQAFAGDGSIPRITLQVGQDPDRAIENIVNESEGCYNGTVKLIRVNEKFLDYGVEALEADYGMLVAESDWEWVTFTLGIPNPLTQRIPLRIGSSKICPWAIPELFKGAECQYTGAETSCTGTIEDCRDNKDNANLWGGELGLDPNATRI